MKIMLTAHSHGFNMRVVLLQARGSITCARFYYMPVVLLQARGSITCTWFYYMRVVLLQARGHLPLHASHSGELPFLFFTSTAAPLRNKTNKMIRSNESLPVVQHTHGNLPISGLFFWTLHKNFWEAILISCSSDS